MFLGKLYRIHASFETIALCTTRNRKPPSFEHGHQMISCFSEFTLLRREPAWGQNRLDERVLTPEALVRAFYAV
jgi:hypothetical protein